MRLAILSEFLNAQGSTADLFGIGIVIFLLILGSSIVILNSIRSARDVVLDLSEKDLLDPIEDESTVKTDRFTEEELLKSVCLDDELGRAGLFTPIERSRFLLTNKLYLVFVPLIGVAIAMVVADANVRQLISISMICFYIGYMIGRRRIETGKIRLIRSIEFYLPLIMERIVMGVQSGRDIIPAIQSVVELEKEGNNSAERPDPVVRLLGMVVDLTENGLSFDESLNYVAKLIDCAALRHAFIHLALAHKEGGELVSPLRELSDSTQLYYQESIEEEIARLPVKATVPLLFTFIGLLIFFVTTPAIEFSKLAKKATTPGGIYGSNSFK